MGLVFNASDYKFAKIVVKDLKQVLNTLDLAIKHLEPYVRYTRPAMALNNLREHRTVIQVQLNRYKNILDSKGLTGV